MNGGAKRPLVWLAAAVGAQAAGVVFIAMLQFLAFVAPPSIGEASAIGLGYAVLIGASAATSVLGMLGAHAAIRALATWKAALIVGFGAAPIVFVGVAEFYATLAMLAVF